MEFYKLSIQLDGREVESSVKEGVLATMETGSISGGIKTPESRISMLAGSSAGKASAWIQIAKVGAAGTFAITHEGWVSEGVTGLLSLGSEGGTQAKIELIDRSVNLASKLPESAEFGVRNCCTGNGNGCYVTCCNCCCRDPTRCPGASCCA